MKAYIFDIDNTLIDTQAKVIVRNSQGEEVQRLSSQEYNSRVLRGSINVSDMDFGEFGNLPQLLSEPLLPAFDKLKEIYKENTNNIFICTCRENTRIIKEWLEAYNVRLPITNIITLDPRIFPSGLVEKALLVKFLASRYDEIHIWEDEPKFINAMMTAAEEYPGCKVIFESLN